MKSMKSRPYFISLLVIMSLLAFGLPLLALLLAAIGAEVAASYVGVAYMWPAYQLVEFFDTKNILRDRLFIDFGVGITFPLGFITCILAWMILGSVLWGLIVLGQRLFNRFTWLSEIKKPQEY